MDSDFEWKLYLLLNPDLRKHKISCKKKAEIHYLEHGKEEKRNYKIKDFSSLTENIELDKYLYFTIQKHRFTELLTCDESLAHYYLYGKNEKLIIKTYQDIYELYKTFNWIGYLYNNQDLLKQNIINKQDCFFHYIFYGIKEKRSIFKNIKDYFDWKLYIYSNQDLFIISNYKKALEHYIQYGIDEERFFYKNLSKKDFDLIDISFENIFSHFDLEYYIQLHHLQKVNVLNNFIMHHWLSKKKVINALYFKNKLSDDYLQQKSSKNINQHQEKVNIENNNNENNNNENNNNENNNNEKNNNEKNNDNVYITFIIPSLARSSLETTLISLQNLESKDWNAIVLFDGVKNNSEIQDERIQYIELEKKVGLLNIKKKHHNYAGYVRNIGFQHLKNTKWVGFVDDDDVIHPLYIQYLKIEEKNEPLIDICLFRFCDKKMHIVPLKQDKYIQKNHCGISFAFKKHVCQQIQFDNNILEDYYFLKKAEYEGYTIVLSNKICYFINLKKNLIKSMNKRIKKINYYNDKSMKLSEECFTKTKKELTKEKEIQDFIKNIEKSIQKPVLHKVDDKIIQNLEKEISYYSNIKHLLHIHRNYINL